MPLLLEKTGYVFCNIVPSYGSPLVSAEYWRVRSIVQNDGWAKFGHVSVEAVEGVLRDRYIRGPVNGTGLVLVESKYISLSLDVIDRVVEDLSAKRCEDTRTVRILREYIQHKVISHPVKIIVVDELTAFGRAYEDLRVLRKLTVQGLAHKLGSNGFTRLASWGGLLLCPDPFRQGFGPAPYLFENSDVL